ncbi:hypothetical protein ACRRTK_009887 [Alexandromys fortis]
MGRVTSPRVWLREAFSCLFHGLPGAEESDPVPGLPGIMKRPVHFYRRASDGITLKTLGWGAVQGKVGGGL